MDLGRQPYCPAGRLSHEFHWMWDVGTCLSQLTYPSTKMDLFTNKPCLVSPNSLKGAPISLTHHRLQHLDRRSETTRCRALEPVHYSGGNWRRSNSGTRPAMFAQPIPWDRGQIRGRLAAGMRAMTRGKGEERAGATLPECEQHEAIEWAAAVILCQIDIKRSSGSGPEQDISMAVSWPTDRALSTARHRLHPTRTQNNSPTYTAKLNRLPTRRSPINFNKFALGHK